MSKIKKILVAYDGSPHSKTALDWAMQIGVDNGAELLVVKVFEPIVETFEGVYYSDATIDEEYKQMMKTDQQKMEDLKVLCKGVCKIKVQVELLKGHVVETLLKYAQKNEVDLIAAGTKGHGIFNEILVGSVTGSLVSLSKVPVLVVKEPPESTNLKKILVAYDGSPHSKNALNWAIDLSLSSSAQVAAVKVFDLSPLYDVNGDDSSRSMITALEKIHQEDQKMMDEVVAIGQNRGVKVTGEIIQGNIAEGILEYAKSGNFDLIVAGTKGHSVIDELLLGSVTRKLVSLAQMPVLVVKD
jgi:nucleotide-binding universal stress UspA family protein